MNLKQQAASQALRYVRDGMVPGLGSRSTTAILVDLLGEQLKERKLKNIVGVPTSEDTARRAKGLGIPLARLADCCDSSGLPGPDLAGGGAGAGQPEVN